MWSIIMNNMNESRDAKINTENDTILKIILYMAM